MNLFGDKFGSFVIAPFNADLLSDGMPIWYESPSVSPIVDVAMIELAEIIENFEQIRARIIYLRGGKMLLECDKNGNVRSAFHAYPRVGSDVYILGFPNGIG